ncbi:nucleotidyltransferase domain-containing protein [Marivirga salinae]|uniref:Nucleotidyltransferase domain-containing protein n=1 Tax=Marivirga salinarum TaxID=3059078 RepID=A0AA51N9A1_9BACT|nr:nucleotidyltransferase domain-containing protein [Marivirga sp. BDSF4-3]WMN10824.1 nucleotidyltransferase domain-containing protein [Marivirga sp. BDSF4-3]
MSFGLPDSLTEKITSILQNHSEVEEALIYGSRAKGNYREGSDIDMVLKGEQLTEAIRNQIFWEIDELNSPYTLDLSIYHQITSQELIQHIDRVGKTLYNRKKQTDRI